jgi:hypothetical protein
VVPLNIYLTIVYIYSLKLHFVGQLINTLKKMHINIIALNFIVVIPSANGDNFNIEKIEIDKRVKNLEWNISQLYVLSFKLSIKIN